MAVAVRIAMVNTEPERVISASVGLGAGSMFGLTGEGHAEGEPAFSVVSEDQFSYGEALYDNDPASQAAHNIIARGIFAGDMHVTGLKMTPRLQMQLRTDYPAFGARLISEFKKHGFAIVTIDRSTGCPCVLHPLSVMVQHRFRLCGQSEYRILPHRHASIGSSGIFSSSSGWMGDDPLSDIIIFETQPPDPRGRLRGPLRALSNIAQYRNSIMQCTAMAVARAALPQVFITQSEAKVSEEKPMRDYLRVGAKANLAAKDAAMAHAMQASRDATMQFHADNLTQKQSLAGFQGAQSLFTSAPQLDATTGVPVYSPASWQFTSLPREYLAAHQDVTAVPASHPPTGITELSSRYDTEVAQIWGVPESLWGSTRSSMATNQTVLNTLYTTLQATRRDLQIIFEVVFVFAYAHESLLQIPEHVEASLRNSIEAGDGRRPGAVRRPTQAKKAKKDKAKRVPQRVDGPRASGDHAGADAPPKADDGKTGVGDYAAEPVPTQSGMATPEEDLSISIDAIAEAAHNSVLSISFPALLDQSILDNLLSTGVITYAVYVEFLSSYYGINKRHLASKRLEPTTGAVLADEIMKTRRIEQLACERGLVDQLATSSEVLRGSVPNSTMGLPFTGARKLPRKRKGEGQGASSGRDKKKAKAKKDKKKDKQSGSGGKAEKRLGGGEKPAVAHRSGVGVTVPAQKTSTAKKAISKGQQHLDRPKNPRVEAVPLRSSAM